jgi:hypothetical protein
MDVGEGWNHVVRGGCYVKGTTTSTPYSNPSPQPATEATEQPNVTATRKTARPKKPQPKLTAATKPAAGKSKKEAAAKPTTPDLVVLTNSPLEKINDLFDRLLLQPCVEVNRQLITSIFSLPTGSARPRDVLKIVILFVAEYGSMP